MDLRRLGVALIAMLTLGPIAADSASAAATTTAAQWFVGATPTTIPVGTSKPLIASIGADPEVGKTFKFETLVGPSTNVPIDLTATGLECVGCSIQNQKAKSNKEFEPVTTESIVATGLVKFKFTGVTVTKPSECGIESEAGVAGQLLFRNQRLHADFMNGTTAVQEFFRDMAGSESFVSFSLTGLKCSLAGSYTFKGRLFSDAVTISEGKEVKKETKKTGKVQEIRFSPAIETADKGSAFPEFKITGTALLQLASGEEFQIK